MKRLSCVLLAFALLTSHRSSANTITLDAALSRTLEKNPEIVQARLALEQAAGRRLVLRSTAYPDVRMQIPAGVQGGKRADEPSVRPFIFTRGFFSQPLFPLHFAAAISKC